MKIRQDQINAKNYERYRRNYHMQIGIAFLTLLMTLGYVYGDTHEITCPRCESVIEIEYEMKGLLKDIWVCPKCSYENYEGISTCCQCGYYRYRW